MIRLGMKRSSGSQRAVWRVLMAFNAAYFLLVSAISDISHSRNERAGADSFEPLARTIIAAVVPQVEREGACEPAFNDGIGA